MRLLELEEHAATLVISSLGLVRASKGNLPKDKDPPTFTGKSCANYNEWLQALERQFRKYPALAASEDLMID